jgi:hypothetical protein
VLTRKWRILEVVGLVVVLCVGALAHTSPDQRATTSARSQRHTSSAELLGCGDLVGTTQWSGTYYLPYYQNRTDVSGRAFATITVAPDGTASGTVGGVGSVNGIISCGDVDLSNNDGTFVDAGTYAPNGQGGVTGSGSFVYNGYSGTWSAATSFPAPTLSLTASTLPVDIGDVTYTATLTGGDPSATGEVDISDGQGGSCSIPSINDGVGSCDIAEQASDSPYTITASYLGDANDSPTSTTLTNTAVVATGGTISTGSTEVQATAQGGTTGVDTLSESEYGTNPVGNLNDGTNYFDVAASAGSTFSSVVIQDCNGVAASTVLSWWDPTANSGAGGWSPVVGDPGPTYDPIAGCLSATLDGTTVPTISQLTGTVFATAIPTPAITSAGGATADAGTPFSHTVTTTGSPTPSLSVSGRLPAGLQFQDNHDGTATLSGTPGGASVGGVYEPTFTATYGSGGTERTVSQTLTLFVFAAPTFTSSSGTSVKVGKTLDFVVAAPGYPPPVITESGSLPRGVKFQTKYNGTAVLSGTPAVGTGGSYPITLTAHNSIGTVTAPRFTLTVVGFYVSSTTLPAGKRGSVYSTTLAAIGGVKPLTWKALSSPPAGLKLSSAGVLSGTPRKSLTAKTYTFTVQVTDSTKGKHKTTVATVTLKLT